MNKSSIIIKAITSAFISIMTCSAMLLIWVSNLTHLIPYNTYIILTAATSALIPIAYLTIPYLINRKHAKPPATETLQKTTTTTPPPEQTPPQTTVTTIEEPTPPEIPTPEEPVKPKPILGTIVCQCGIKFSSFTMFNKHMAGTGHHAEIESPIEEETPEPTHPEQQPTPQTEQPKPPTQTIEQVEEEIKLTTRLIELEKQKAELERTRTVVTGLTSIRNNVANNKVNVTASNDLLTKSGPAKEYIKISPKTPTPVIEEETVERVY